MKKIISMVICALMLSGLFGGLTAIAEPEISVYLDGERLGFDVSPQIIDNRTMVPMRAIFEALGVGVDWIDDEYEIAKGIEEFIWGNEYYEIPNAEIFDWVAYRPVILTRIEGVTLQIGSSAMFIDKDFNYRWVELDVPPMIVDNRTMVPLRAIAEATGANVEWNGDTRIITITTSAVNENATNSDTAIVGNISQRFDTVWSYNSNFYALEFNRAPEWQALPIPEDSFRFAMRNGHIYYLDRDSSLYRSDLDGQNVISLTDDVNPFPDILIIDDSIIYINSASNAIYHLNLNTLEITRVINISSTPWDIFFADSEFVYFNEYDFSTRANRGFRVRFDGFGKTENDAYLNLSDVRIVGEYVYYWDNTVFDIGRLVKVNKNNISDIVGVYEIDFLGSGGGGFSLDLLEEGFVFAFPRSFTEDYYVMSQLYRININDQSQNIRMTEFVGKNINRLWVVGNYIYLLIFDNITYSSEDTEVLHYSIHKLPINGGEVVFTGKEWVLNF